MATWEYAPLPAAALPREELYLAASDKVSHSLEAGRKTIMFAGGSVSCMGGIAFKFHRVNQHAVAVSMPGYVIMRPVNKTQSWLVCRRVSQEARIFRLSHHVTPTKPLMALDCIDENTNELVMTIYANPAWTMAALKKAMIGRLCDLNVSSPQAQIGFEVAYAGGKKVGTVMAEITSRKRKMSEAESGAEVDAS
jgi:hypothetical protein